MITHYITTKYFSTLKSKPVYSYIGMLSKSYNDDNMEGVKKTMKRFNKSSFIDDNKIKILNKYVNNLKSIRFTLYKCYYKFKNLINVTSINTMNLSGDEIEEIKKEDLVIIRSSKYNQVFTFTLKEIKKIIEGSLTNTSFSIIPEPKQPFNPYNRKKFSEMRLWSLYSIFKQRQQEPMMFKMFMECKFNLKIFNDLFNKMLINRNMMRYINSLSNEDIESYYEALIENISEIHAEKYSEEYGFCFSCCDNFDRTKFYDLIKQSILAFEVNLRDRLRKSIEHFVKKNKDWLFFKRSSQSKNELCPIHMKEEFTSGSYYELYIKGDKRLCKIDNHIYNNDIEEFIDYTKLPCYTNGVFHFGKNRFLVSYEKDKYIDLKDIWYRLNQNIEDVLVLRNKLIELIKNIDTISHTREIQEYSKIFNEISRCRNNYNLVKDDLVKVSKSKFCKICCVFTSRKSQNQKDKWNLYTTLNHLSYLTNKMLDFIKNKNKVLLDDKRMISYEINMTQLPKYYLSDLNDKIV